jgi:hypothetical protein
MTFAKTWFGPRPIPAKTFVPDSHGSCGCCGCGCYTEPASTPFLIDAIHGESLDEFSDPLGCPDTIIWPEADPITTIVSASDAPIKVYGRVKNPKLKVTISGFPSSTSAVFDFSTYAVSGWDELNGVYEYDLPVSQYGCLMPLLPSVNTSCATANTRDVPVSKTINNALTINGSPPVGEDTLFLKAYPVVSRRGRAIGVLPRTHLDSVQFVVSAMFNRSATNNRFPIVRAPASGSGFLDTTRGTNEYTVVETVVFRTGENLLTPVDVAMAERCVSTGSCGATGSSAGTIRMEILSD